MAFPVWMNHFWPYSFLQHLKNSALRKWIKGDGPWVPLQGESGCSSVDFHSQGCSRSPSGLLERCDLMVLTQTRASGLQGPGNRKQKCYSSNRKSGKPLQGQMVDTFAENTWCLPTLKHIVFLELVAFMHSILNHYVSLATFSSFH